MGAVCRKRSWPRLSRVSDILSLKGLAMADDQPTTRRSKHKGLIVSTAVLFAIVALIWSSCERYTFKHYRRYVPAPIEITSVVTVLRDRSALTAIADREACGGAVLRLHKKTIAAIQQQGLAFFDNARVPATHQRPPYKAWKPTPVPPFWAAAGRTRSSFECMGNSSWTRSILKASQRPGGFYASMEKDHPAELLVLPDLGIVLFTYAR